MKKFLLITPLILLVTFAFSQNRQISGKVTEKASGLAVIGASVIVEESGKGTTTDGSGSFKIDAQTGQTLKISYLGMETARVKVTSDNSVTVILTEDRNFLEEVVVTGYQTERKKDLIGAVSVLKMDDALKETNTNLLTSVQGRVAGVSISTDGAPGTNTTINIRGLGSLKNNAPLYIIDGMPANDINGISPNDIASMQILKDASSAAIYGARAAGGVVLITTKKGTTRDVSVTFDAFTGIKTPRNRLEMLNAKEYGQVLFQTLKNDGLPLNDAIYGSGPEPVIPQFLDDNNTIPSADVDYQRETYRPATNQSYNLGISKNVDNSNFYFGINYNKEEGLAVNTNYDRLNARLNSSFAISDRITLGENFTVSRFGGTNNPGALPAALYQMPIIPIKDNAGNWGGPVKNLGDRLSPMGNLARNKDNRNNSLKTLGNVFANVKLFRGLSYNLLMGVDAVNYRASTFNPTFVEGRFSNTEATLNETSSNALNLNATHTLNYQLRNEKHDFKALAGYEWIHNKFENHGATARGFFIETPEFRVLNAANTMSAINGGASEFALISQFAKLDYQYNSKYLLSATIRRDGSSRFGPENKYGIFPAAAFGWRLSEENFFKNSSVASKISDLKFRLSWGMNGNQQSIDDYSYTTSYERQVDFSNYDITGSNSSANTGYLTTRIGNPNIKWETAVQTNIGMDLGLFNNNLYLTADYFIKNSKDLLINPVLAAVEGEGNAPYINAGDVRNTGFEFLLSYRNNTSGKFKYNVDLTFSAIKNRVVSLGEDGNAVYNGSKSRIISGQPIGEFYGYVADGLFRTQQEVDNHAVQAGKGLGRIRFKDVNNDGQITPDDRTNIGSPLPKFITGLNFNSSYANFDVSLFLDAQVGNKIWDDNTFNYKFPLFIANHGKVLLDAWSPSNPDSDIPALTTKNENNEQRNSTFFLGDGSYLRMKSIAIGYTIPKAISNKVNISKARIFVQGQNLLNFTKFDGLDYEVVNNGTLDYGVLGEAAYPHAKSISLGLNIGF